MSDTRTDIFSEIEAQIAHFAGEVWDGQRVIHVVVAERDSPRVVGVRVDEKLVLSYDGPRSTERIYAALKAMFEVKP